ncbi:MAG: WYL domain-containing protein [Myxococcota bacterium]|nr:WYL domain-containing protein [Myxococcota bacterium]
MSDERRGADGRAQGGGEDLGLRVPGPINARRREPARPIKAEAAPSRVPQSRKEIPIPVLRGKLFRTLRRATPLRNSGETLRLSSSGEAVQLDTVELKAAAAFSGILAANLLRHSGSRLPSRGLENLMERLLPSLNAQDLMSLEVEAYDLMQWLATQLRSGGARRDDAVVAEEGASSEDEGIEFDPEQGKLELIERAISEGFELEMLYYTGGRGELLARRVKPQRVEAEKYLHAYCHRRKSERVFRISRIARVEPVGGRAVKRSETETKPSSRKPSVPATKQRGLFDEQSEE